MVAGIDPRFSLEKMALRKGLFASSYYIRLLFAIIADVGLRITGFEDRPDWPKMGPSLLIAASLILAIRTAKWAARSDNTASNMDLEKEIDHAAYLAGRVLAKLVARNPSLFPQAKKAWYQPDGEDEPK
jgi:hypothetical protein